VNGGEKGNWVSLDLKLPGQLDSRFRITGKYFTNHSEQLVRDHISIIFFKLGVASRTKTITLARSAGFAIWLLKVFSIG
jgi:hypothetical protein